MSTNNDALEDARRMFSGLSQDQQRAFQQLLGAPQHPVLRANQANGGNLAALADVATTAPPMATLPMAPTGLRSASTWAGYDMSSFPPSTGVDGPTLSWVKRASDL
mmetsp:Transcript_35154/g.81467  ORF Transcript_35154/g.81467 Transcript_35154/m.81467 type:complete len:106 (-) Transcript_35154:3269-3586(-)